MPIRFCGAWFINARSSYSTFESWSHVLYASVISTPILRCKMLFASQLMRHSLEKWEKEIYFTFRCSVWNRRWNKNYFAVICLFFLNRIAANKSSGYKNLVRFSIITTAIILMHNYARLQLLRACEWIFLQACPGNNKLHMLKKRLSCSVEPAVVFLCYLWLSCFILKETHHEKNHG